MVTLKMLAKTCGVSVATVSKALNGAPDISAETTARIQKVADEMGYIPCAAARYLKTSQTNNIGVIFDDGTNSGLTHEHFAHILDSFKRRSEELGYDITFISDQRGPWGSDFVTHVRYRNCDGVAVLVADNAAAAVQEFVRSGVPVISVDYHFENCSCIESDNVGGMQQLVQYIYDQGHRRIAAIFGDDTPVTRVRMSAFFHTCARLGLEIPEEYVISGVFHESNSSARATRQLMALPEPPTCILYPDDISLLGGMTEIERHGLRIPDDISIVGFDGIPLSRVLRPSLTTLCQDSETLGTRAAQLLIEAIEEPKLFVPRVVTVPGWVQPGQTVKKLS